LQRAESKGQRAKSGECAYWHIIWVEKNV